MRVMKTTIQCEDGSQRVCDTIQHDGKLWLVPAWVDDASQPYSRPVRLIGMSGLKYWSMPMHSAVDFVVEDRVPEAILQGTALTEPEVPYVILERPDVRITTR